MSNKMLTGKEAIAILGIGHCNLKLGRHAGRALTRYHVGNLVKYKKDDVLELLEQRRIIKAKRMAKKNHRHLRRQHEEFQRRARAPDARYTLEKSGYRHHVYCGSFWVANCASEEEAKEYLTMQRGKPIMQHLKH